jgi:hypothetical protein
MDEEPADDAVVMDKCAERRYRRNYRLGLVNGALFRASQPLLDHYTIIPVFIGALTPANFIVGLAVGLRLAGRRIPQMFIANTLTAKERKNPTYITAGFLRIAALAGMALTIWLAGFADPALLLVLFLVFWTAFYFFAGLSHVPFVDVIAKTVPIEKISRLWAYRMFFGGILAVGSGFMVKGIQSVFDFPTDFAVIFTIATVIVTSAIVIWFFALEQKDKVVREKKPLPEHFRECVGILRNDGQFRALFAFRSLIMVWFAGGAPFIIRYAQARLEVDMDYLGYFVAVQTFGLLSSNLLWARMSNSDRMGRCRGVLIGAGAIALVTHPAAMLLSLPALESLVLPLLFVIFFLVGAARSGIILGFMNSLIRISPAETRPIYLGVMNTFLVPAVLAIAFTSGAIVDILSFEVMFALSSAAAFVSVLAARRLRAV